MQIIKTKDALKDFSRKAHKQHKTIGVVLTMGSLHVGHLSLVDALKPLVDVCIVTCFVNPVQFNDPKDYTSYPRDVGHDARLLEENGGVDVFYVPAPDDIYPQDFSVTIDIGHLGQVLCGTDRKGHFNGVALVVTKLLLQTHADIAAFGEKDYQQLAIIRRLVRDLDIDTEILAVPTWRHEDGLAYASRNRRLSKEMRTQASLLPAIMKRVCTQLKQGEAAPVLLEGARHALTEAGFVVQYLELYDGQNLHPITSLQKGARLFAAATIEGVRLIDNMAVED